MHINDTAMLKTVAVQVPYNATNIRVQYEMPKAPQNEREFNLRQKEEERLFIKRVRAEYDHLRCSPGLRGSHLLEYAHSAWELATESVGWGPCVRFSEERLLHWDAELAQIQSLAKSNIDALLRTVLDLQFECRRETASEER